MSTDAVEMVSIPRAELDAMRAELRELRLAVARQSALARIQANPGPSATDIVFTAEEFAAWRARG